MVLLYGVALVLLVFAVVDVVSSPREAVRTLPKVLWLLVVLPPFLGPAAWFLVGRPTRGAVAPTVTRGAPDDDEDFLRELRKRAEEQRRRARDPRDD